MQISVVTALFNRLDLTRACVASLPRTLAGWDYEWIFLDDGSTDGTREFLRALPDDGRTRVIFNAERRGFAANNNHGARLARSPLLCLLNNDTVLRPGWLEPMARLARRLPDVACVGNVQREPVSGLVDHAGIFFDADGEARHAAKDKPAPPPADYLEWPAVTAACCVVRREVFLGLDGFDETFRNGSEDLDFCLRAGARGYRHYVANRSVIFHHVSASPGRKEGEEENRRRFRERWGGFLQTEGRTRRTVAWRREEAWRYLRENAWRPWRFNGWQLARAAGQIAAWRPPSRQLDPVPRLLFGAAEELRAHWTRRRHAREMARREAASVFLVVGDTAQTARRAGVPTAVRALAGGFGRMSAPVRLAAWKPATRSLGVLPPEWSVGLDAEKLRVPLAPTAAAICDPSAGDGGEGEPDTPSLHELPDPARPPPGAWVLLPEVPDPDRLEALVGYVHRQGWRLAVIFYGALPTNEPRLFPFGAATAHERYLRAVAGADLLLPVSGTAAEHWRLFAEAKGLASPPVRVCGPGVDTCTRERGSGGPGPPGGPVRMLCVSEVTPHKNHRALLAAFDLAAAARPELNLELCLVGMPRLFDEDNVPAAVRAFVERWPGRVTWFDRVEYSALRRLYEEADFTVFPSVLEGWGLPIVESLWFGKPCVCADSGAMGETAAGGGCLTVDVRDPQALADAMVALAADPARRAALAAEIERRPLKRWEDYTHELLAVLAEV